MRLSIFTTTLCLALVQPVPAIALSNAGDLEHGTSAATRLSPETTPRIAQYRQLRRSQSARRKRAAARSSSQSSSTSQPRRRSTSAPTRSRSVTPARIIRRVRSRHRPSTQQRPKSSPTTRRNRSLIKSIKARQLRNNTTRKSTNVRAKRQKRVNPVTRVTPSKRRSLRSIYRPRIKNRSVVKRYSKPHVRSPYRLRRIVRTRRVIPYWGSRRVRSRRLTRAYRPCYYCPGIGWSYSPICNTRSRRYYVYSDSYVRLWPDFSSYVSRSRRSEREQSLVKQVEIAIQDYAELYELEDLADTIEVKQEGSIIILSGEVETEETLEDLVAIARDIEGVRYVITDDVVVNTPTDTDDDLQLQETEPFLEGEGRVEPSLVFTTISEDSAESEEASGSGEAAESEEISGLEEATEFEDAAESDEILSEISDNEIQ